jgi:hypothetical protein
MYARRAFIHWYVNEGLETVEFDEARSNMTDLSRSTRCTRPLGWKKQARLRKTAARPRNGVNLDFSNVMFASRVSLEANHEGYRGMSSCWAIAAVLGK